MILLANDENRRIALDLVGAERTRTRATACPSRERHRSCPTDLPDALRERELPDGDDDLPFGAFERLLRDYKYELACEALQQCSGNKTLAEQTLSISRAYLHRLLRHSDGTPETSVAEIPARTPAFAMATAAVST